MAAAINAISRPLAAVPARIYEVGSGGRREVEDHPFARLIRMGVNETATWPDLVEAWVASALTNGNGLVEVETDGRALSGLRFIPWGWVTVTLAGTGRLVYDVSEATGVYGQTGRTRRLLADSVLHLRDRTDDGYLGRSRLSRSADTVAAALATNRFAARFMQNGARPAGHLSAPGLIADETAARLKAQMEEAYTGDGVGRLLVTGDGLEFKPLSITPEDAELLESRRFSVLEIARLFEVPPPLLMAYENNSFTNATTAGRWFSMFTLTPWARKIEATINRAIFPDGRLALELDLSGFMRGDPEARWQAHAVALDKGVLTPNEVRDLEGWGPLPGGTATAGEA